MKSLLVVLLYGITLEVLSATTAAPTDTAVVPSLAEINKERQEFAKDNKIANMNELVWDDGLTKTAKAMSSDCSNWKHGSDYRFMPLEANENFTSIGVKTVYMAYQFKVPAEQLRAQIGQEIETSGADSSISYLIFEELIPTQTKVGCAETKCSSKAPETSAKGVCLFGPSNTIKVTDFKDGEPGSACLTEKTAGGLCKPVTALASGFNLTGLVALFFCLFVL